MRLLLDTHALLWWLLDDPKLPPRCADWLRDRSNDVAISPVSAYELQFKARKGLLHGIDGLIEELPAPADQEGFTFLPLLWAHAVAAADFPLPHRDPFDRLLGAQAMTDGYELLSINAAFDGLGVPRVL